ncbi:MAG: hypothetical protein K9G70_03225 [Prolixibacteraceae bacterium]|nr:hypothetical protein [Prolixibacteraceae bacterium]
MKTAITLLLCLFVFQVVKAQDIQLNETFDDSEMQIDGTGKGLCQVDNGRLVTQNVYAAFGEADWKNYRISFDAVVPETEDQVQIWAGFREQNRNDRYIVGVKGGIQNDLVLARLGRMANDEFLGIRTLDFSLEKGQRYTITIEVCNNRIRVFLNDEKQPRIDVNDSNANLLPSGKITLGGSWIKTAYDNLKVELLPEDYLESVPVKEYNVSVSNAQIEKKRKLERAGYDPVVVSELNDTRTEISLNGNWLFKPGYEIHDHEKVVLPDTDDMDWHIMNVPDFWNPIRIWLHGEKFDGHPKGVSDTYFQKETKRCEDFTFDYQKTKEAWYRQWVELPEAIEGKRIELSFDAVSKVAEVYVNGKLAGSHIGMFGAFNVEATDLFKPGKNLVVVKVLRDYVENIENAGELKEIAVTVEVTNDMLKDLAHGFYKENPAGIWQPVKLLITDELFIKDVYIKPSLSGAEFDVTISNNSNKKADFNIQTHINEVDTDVFLCEDELDKKQSLEAGGEKVFTYSIDNLKPKLWSPSDPNLYDFSFSLVQYKGKEVYDTKVITSGFRTFETRGDYFYLNGNRYWLRGANHTPFALAPNDTALADLTFQLYKQANIEVTRTHTTPYNKVWMEAADRNGFGISFEGTWPWLMITNSMPEKELLHLWEKEWYEVIKKYRNHPSLLFWTVNNEMKFHKNDPDLQSAKQKMFIVSDVVKQMREIDPTRPICLDSGYLRNEKKFGKEFLDSIDDGDIDDKHWYVNWYHGTLFNEFNGERQKRNKNEGRPFISQEMSTGYPNNETGHPTRSYTFLHQTPQSLVGNYSYAFADPKYFLESHAFITAELAEALRRSNDKIAGIMHFASITWFRNVYDTETVEPYPVYDRMKNAMQPVLVSAELWGRHFYAGEKIPARVCVINDKQDGVKLNPSTLKWQICDIDNRVLASGTNKVPAVNHYEREWVQPEMIIPSDIPSSRLNGKLKLSLEQNNKIISSNEYPLVFAENQWLKSELIKDKKLVLLDYNGHTNNVFDFLKLNYNRAESIGGLFEAEADVYVISGLEENKNMTEDEAKLIRAKLQSGKRMLLLNSGANSAAVFPGFIKEFLKSRYGDIVNMEVPESDIFHGLDYLDLRYFNNNEAQVPRVCNGGLRLEDSENTIPLASHTKIHGYLRGDLKDRHQEMSQMRSHPIVEINNGGKAILSEMTTEKALYDPVAGKLLMNMMRELLK